MKAIIKSGGLQYIVEESATIFLEKLDAAEGEEYTFKEVLLVGNKIGNPLVEGALVKGVVQKQGKKKKIVVYRHNPKSTHKRKLGHRQLYTRVLITEIQA